MRASGNASRAWGYFFSASVSLGVAWSGVPSASETGAINPVGVVFHRSQSVRKTCSGKKPGGADPEQQHAVQDDADDQPIAEEAAHRFVSSTSM